MTLSFSCFWSLCFHNIEEFVAMGVLHVAAGKYRGHKVITGDNMCFLSARFNMELVLRAVHPEKEFRMVAGSLGIGTREPFFEYGGPDMRTVSDFRNSKFTRKTGDGIGWDAHVWIEDKEGFVYDVVTPHMKNVAFIHDKELAANDGDILFMIRKADMTQMGLHYIEADKMCQEVLLRSMDRDWTPAYNQKYMSVKQKLLE